MQTFSFLLTLAYFATSASWAGPIGIGSSTQTLSYGSLVAGSGGSVIVSSLGRSASGGVILLPSGSWSVALFNVTGDPGLTYATTLPGNGVVFLTSGSNTMAVNNFTSNPTGQLSAGGSQTLMVGATLSVGSNQASGSYNGSFNVIIDYN